MLLLKKNIFSVLYEYNIPNWKRGQSAERQRHYRIVEREVEGTHFFHATQCCPCYLLFAASLPLLSLVILRLC